MADAGSSRGPVSGAAARLRNVFAAVHAGHHYEGLKASLSSPNVIRVRILYGAQLAYLTMVLDSATKSTLVSHGRQAAPRVEAE